MKTRMLSVSALVVLGGMVAYIYNGPPVDSLQSDRSISASSAPRSAPSSSQIEINDAAQIASAESVEAAANGMQVGNSLVLDKVVSTVRNDAPINDGNMEGQHQVNAAVNSSFLSQSILSSRARVRKISSVPYAGLNLEQRRTQMKYQTSASKQQLSLLRNQLRQMELLAKHPAQGNAVSDKNTVDISNLKSRVQQLEAQLAKRLRGLNRFQKQFPVSGQYAKKSARMESRAHHGWN